MKGDIPLGRGPRDGKVGEIDDFEFKDQYAGIADQESDRRPNLMFQFNGWFQLGETTDGEEDDATLVPALEGLAALVGRLKWPTADVDIVSYNWCHYLRLTGVAERRHGPEADDIDSLLEFIAFNLPGSYGLLYERSDEEPDSMPGPDSFLVRVMARGVVQTRLDPFLSPTKSIIRG